MQLIAAQISSLMVGLPAVLGSSIAELGSVIQQIREEAAIIVWSARTVGDDGRLYLRLSWAVCECDQLAHITERA